MMIFDDDDDDDDDSYYDCNLLITTPSAVASPRLHAQAASQRSMRSWSMRSSTFAECLWDLGPPGPVPPHGTEVLLSA